jgi:uncharacterized protein (DUF58 family)
MHLTVRSLVLVVLAALLAIAAMWSGAPSLRGLWAAPLALLALGLAVESAQRSRRLVEISAQLRPRFYLGRNEVVVLRLRHAAAATLHLDLLPRLPECLAGDESARRLALPAGQVAELPLTVTPVALGEFRWPPLPARLLGVFGLAWWSCELAFAAAGRVQPDLRVHRQVERPGWRSGLRARRETGTGSDLQQLRDYRPGDPLSRIAWRSSARHGRLLAREFSDEQQLDLLLVVDAGLRTRARAGRLDRLGAAINAAAGFAESAIARDDRVGLLVYADRPQAVARPARGAAALLRVRALLGEARVAAVESDPVAAALQARRLLRHRALIVWLTEIDDAAAVGELDGVLRLLSPPHLVVFAGASGGEVGALARAPARGDRDVWVALAAGAHEERLAAGLRRLQRRGAPVVCEPAERLEPAVLATYARLRERHRV